MLDILNKKIRIQGSILRVACLDAEKHHTLDDPEPVLAGLRTCGTRVDLFTFMEKLPVTRGRYPYPMEWDNLAVLPVSTFDHWWNHQINSFPRNRARQAGKKGVVIREVSYDDSFVRGIWQIYNETPVRQGRRFPHYGKDVQTVRREGGTYLDTSIFIGAFVGEELIGFIKLVHDESKSQAGLMNILSLNRHRDKAPTNALLAQAVRSCADRGISHLVFSNFAFGEKQESSLAHFKEVNGFHRVDVPRYYVPLTALGRAGFRLGLHRRLTERIPESLASKLREIREAWYGLRFHSAIESR